MRKDSRKRTSFRPEMSGAALEERVVLSLPPGFTFVTPQQAVQFRAAFNLAFARRSLTPGPSSRRKLASSLPMERRRRSSLLTLRRPLKDRSSPEMPLPRIC